MTDRRFNDAEVAAIFERAAEAQQSGRLPPSTGEGMTLAQLRDIGAEVGIAPNLIDQAARAIARDVLPAPSRTFLGLPLGVERIVHLDRRLSDEEWERFVVDLRETFDARGTMRQEGSMRSWSNGNLQALLEPTATGYRVRLRTRKGDAPALMATGLAMSGFAAAALVAAAVRGALGDAGFLATVGFLATMGAGMFAWTALRLPSWARRRQQQMENIAARLTLSASPESPDHSPTGDAKSDI